jgi:hypothetical protein
MLMVCNKHVKDALKSLDVPHVKKSSIINVSVHFAIKKLK